jgi:hypothetical protein
MLVRGMRGTLRRLRSRMRSRRDSVTLVIYGWHESQPGTLAWVFPSLRAALEAVHAMRNAIGWLIVRGKRAFSGDIDVDALRRTGHVLVEHAA